MSDVDPIPDAILLHEPRQALDEELDDAQKCYLDHLHKEEQRMGYGMETDLQRYLRGADLKDEH